MTCIAWDGRLLVADGQSSYGNQIIHLDQRKLLRTSTPDLGPMVAGLSGATNFFQKWLDAIARDGFTAPVGNWDDAMGLFVDRRGQCFEAYANGTYSKPTSYAATGSGGSLAYAVMRDGGSAIDAVRYASKHLMSCGGDIRAYCPVSNVMVRLRA